MIKRKMQQEVQRLFKEKLANKMKQIKNQSILNRLKFAPLTIVPEEEVEDDKDSESESERSDINSPTTR